MDTNLGQLQSGELVRERQKPHSNPISDDAASLISKILATIVSDNRGVIVQEFRSEHVIGKTLCVKTSEEDEIYYARKYRSKEWFRFVKNREAEDSKLLTIILRKDNSRGGYILTHRYIGDKGKINPSLSQKFFYKDINKYVGAVNYWNHHAFIDGSKDIDPNTITTVCPWWYEINGK